MNATCKKIALLMLCLSGISMANAQIAVGKTSVDGSGILDFGTDNNKGIILPWVDVPSSSVTFSNGTLLYNTATRKVEAYINGSWRGLSKNGDDTATYTTAITEHLARTEAGAPGTSGAIMGANTSGAVGILVLESSTKALIVPKMASPHLNMPNPAPGTMVYDTDKNLLCVYNGKEWSFWGI